MGVEHTSSSIDTSFGVPLQQQWAKLECTTACGCGANLVLSLFRCKFSDLSFINLFVLFDPQACSMSKELSYRSCGIDGKGIGMVLVAC